MNARRCLNEITLTYKFIPPIFYPDVTIAKRKTKLESFTTEAVSHQDK